MDTTPIYGIPFPEATDLVIAGDDDMEAIAFAVEAQLARLDEHLVRQWHGVTAATPVQPVAGSGTLLGYDSGAGSGHFAFSAGVLTYEGASPRWFYVSAGAVITASGALPGSTLALRHAGVDVVRSRTNSTYQSHQLSVPALLEPGHTLSLIASHPNADTSASATEVYLRVASL